MRSASVRQMESPIPRRGVQASSGSLGAASSAFELVRRDAGPFILHREVQFDLLVTLVLRLGDDEDVAGGRELHRVGDQVDQDLAQSRRVADDGLRHGQVDLAVQIDAALGGAHGHDVERLVHGAGGRRTRASRAPVPRLRGARRRACR